MEGLAACVLVGGCWGGVLHLSMGSQCPPGPSMGSQCPPGPLLLPVGSSIWASEPPPGRPVHAESSGVNSGGSLAPRGVSAPARRPAPRGPCTPSPAHLHPQQDAQASSPSV